MKKILILSLCAVALSVNGATAKSKQQKATHSQTTGMSQGRIPGNPYAGGGSAGANQATNGPNASNEIAGGR